MVCIVCLLIGAGAVLVLMGTTKGKQVITWVSSKLPRLTWKRDDS